MRQKALLRFTEAVHTEIGSPRCWNISFVVELSHPHSTTLFNLIYNHFLLVLCFFSHPRSEELFLKMILFLIVILDNFAISSEKLPYHIRYCEIISFIRHVVVACFIEIL